MSVRLEMLQVARLAPQVLGESADLVRAFLLSQQNEDGGFKDRAGQSDLYYTVFGIEGLLALQAPLPMEKLNRYLAHFGGGENLDFVHLCCLARCRAALMGRENLQHLDANPGHGLERPLTRPSGTLSPIGGEGGGEAPPGWSAAVSTRIERFRSADGGYNALPDSSFGSAYASFLALAASQDLRTPIPDSLRVVQSLKFLETPDGAWANERGLKLGSTNSTAAVVTLLLNLSMPVAPGVGDWLLARAHSQGGFVAAPAVTMPDLLSTATTLHALAGLERNLGPIKERCLDFVDTLWSGEGGFHGHWGDDLLDCEYTYYGLLALGHLSL